jgi:hypothetical protein
MFRAKSKGEKVLKNVKKINFSGLCLFMGTFTRPALVPAMADHGPLNHRTKE